MNGSVRPEARAARLALEKGSRVVAVDIGGTHARFALAEIGFDGSIAVDDPITLQTGDYASFQTAWEAFAQRVEQPLPDAVAIAVAGPMDAELIRFTNNPWIIRPKLIPEKLGVSRWTVINDFAAVGHAVARAGPTFLAHLAGPEEELPAAGTVSVIGPGTGLGVAQVWRSGLGGYRVHPTEGGHVDFAPLDSIEDAILARLRQRHTRVSVERVVSGPAIVDIYETLAAIEGRAVYPLADTDIWQRGTSGADSLATAAVDRFCMSLGSIAGDMALAHGAVGVVIAGGLGLRIKDTLMTSGFASRFRAKGRFAGLLARLPVKMIVHPQPGLFGAAAAFAAENLAAE